MELFAVNDETFMDMFIAHSAMDFLRNERQVTQKHLNILQYCLNKFWNLARALLVGSVCQIYHFAYHIQWLWLALWTSLHDMSLIL